MAGAVASAQVDLNPHQIDAALFAFNSPLSKGALLADEVGLGKTIEAGLVLSQKLAEKKRRILIITSANLRKQWFQEMAEKFFLPCRILESKSYNAAIKRGNLRPFERPEIILCSYQFARSKASDVQAVPWDLVAALERHDLAGTGECPELGPPSGHQQFLVRNHPQCLKCQVTDWSDGNAVKRLLKAVSQGFVGIGECAKVAKLAGVNREELDLALAAD